MNATKCVTQRYVTNERILDLMETFRLMVNHCIRLGLKYDCSSLKRMSILCYHDLEQYDVLSYYKLSAMSRACVILKNRKQSIRRGISTKIPHMKKLLLTSCYGFKLDKDMLRIAMGDKNYFEIPLTAYVKKILLDKCLKKHTFILTRKFSV